MESFSGEIISVGQYLELSGIYGDCCPKKEISLCDLRVLSPLQKHSLVFGVVEIDGLIGQVEFEQKLLVETCLLIIPFGHEHKSIFGCHFNRSCKLFIIEFYKIILF